MPSRIQDPMAMQYMNAPPDIQAGASEIFRQKQMADLLRKQSMEPVQADQYTKAGSGQWAAPAQIVPVSWAQGLGKLAQAAGASYMDSESTKKNAELATKLRDYNSGQIDQYSTLVNGKPEGANNDIGPDGTLTEPAVPANPEAARSFALKSYNPMLLKAGEHQLTSDLEAANTQRLLKAIQGAQSMQQPSAPTQAPAPAPISTSNEVPTRLSPVSEVAAPAGPLTPEQQQLIAADMARRGDAQGQSALVGAVTPPAPVEPTPLETYTKQVGYTQQQAQAMEASGNKTLMALGKRINAGYQQATLETAIKQPGRQQLAAQNNDAKGARQQVGIDAAGARQDKQIAAVKDRVESLKEGSTLADDEADYIARQYIAGDKSAISGLARSKAAMQQVRSKIARIGITENIPPEELAQRMAEYGGMVASQRTIGTQVANVNLAANEANKMIGVTEKYIDKINPTEYPSLNAIKNAIDKGTGGKDIVALNTSLNSLVNVYARAINPKGVATVSDKEHARELIDKALSKGQLGEALSVMRAEMDAALESGPTAIAQIRKSRGLTTDGSEKRASAAATPSPTLGVGSLPNQIPTNDPNAEARAWLAANPNDPRAAAVKAKLGIK